jgi:hypothetical protein
MDRVSEACRGRDLCDAPFPIAWVVQQLRHEVHFAHAAHQCSQERSLVIGTALSPLPGDFRTTWCCEPKIACESRETGLMLELTAKDLRSGCSLSRVVGLETVDGISPRRAKLPGSLPGDLGAEAYKLSLMTPLEDLIASLRW